MGKRARRVAPARDVHMVGAAEVPVVGPREPCPCGSGKRYKVCHGKERARSSQALVRRPFEGLANECDWVALREIVPAATARLTPAPEYAGYEIVAATILPMAWPALRRRNGVVMLGLQTRSNSGDVSRDIADALIKAVALEPGSPVEPGELPGAGPRLQDVLDPKAPLEVIVHERFDFWLEDDTELTPEVSAATERANAAIIPTARIASVEAAYWCQARERNHLRWVLPYPENELLDALARLHAAGALGLGDGTRFVGSFRAHGLVVPVWDLPRDMSVEDVEEPAQEFERRLGEALAVDEPLTVEERRARNGLLSRQLTIR